ncbi:MAG: hypothetical protein ACRDDF_00695, partial [Aeromonas sp.]
KSVLDYLDRLKLIADHGKVAEDVLVTMALKGLSEDWEGRITSALQADQHLSWQNLYRIGSTYRNLPPVRKQKVEQINNDQDIHGETFQITKRKKYEKRQYNRKKEDKAKRKYCFFHEREGHLTSECWELKKLKESRGKTNPISTRKIIESENSDESINGKSDYIVFGINSNPFKFKTTYNKRTIKVLLDTGSDVNVINKTLIEVNEKIYTSDAKLKVANGERLQVIGKVNGIEVEIMGKSCVIDALVVDINENLLILGVPFTDKYVAGLKIQNKRLEIEWKLKEIKNQKETFNINQSVCTDFKNIFADDNTSLTGCDLIEHTITMNDPTPIAKSMYRLGYNLENAVEQEVMKLLRDKIIRPSKSPWRAPVVPILKKNGQIRLCIDYRGLNENTKKDKYPMPLIDEIIDGLQ